MYSLFDMCASQQVGARGYTTPTGFSVIFCIIIAATSLLYTVGRLSCSAFVALANLRYINALNNNNNNNNNNNPHARNGIMLEVYGL